MSDSPKCACGHRKYDHFLGSCDEGTKRCRCMQFTHQPMTLAEQLDATQSGEEFGQVILGLFKTLETMEDNDDN